MTSLAARLTQRLLQLRYELGKFGVVGIIAYVIDTAVFTGLLYSGVERNQAKIIATVIAASLAFLGNRFWTWRERERSGLAREYLLYFFFNAAGLGIQLAVLNFSHSVLGSVWPVFATSAADVIAAQVMGNGVATVFRFWAYRRFVFVAPATVEVGR